MPRFPKRNMEGFRFAAKEGVKKLVWGAETGILVEGDKSLVTSLRDKLNYGQ
jgi:hypothetical protein